ncbi:MAG: hypothetical protein M5U26_07680 [Planctomycetota bacterium]|nr:hypothetical protein [Planctomycetota bacterium]
MNSRPQSPRPGAGPPAPNAKSPPGPQDPPEAHAAHESLCTECGICCYKKIIIGRTVFVTPFPCEFLDTDRNRCTVYEERFEKNPECLSISEGLKHSAFPASCPYVEAYAPPGYRPAIDTWDWEGEWMNFDELSDLLTVSDAMREKIRARGPWARPMWLEAQERKLDERARADAAEPPPKLVDLRRAPASEPPPRLSAFVQGAPAAPKKAP